MEVWRKRKMVKKNKTSEEHIYLKKINKSVVLSLNFYQVLNHPSVCFNST